MNIRPGECNKLIANGEQVKQLPREPALVFFCSWNCIPSTAPVLKNLRLAFLVGEISTWVWIAVVTVSHKREAICPCTFLLASFTQVMHIGSRFFWRRFQLQANLSSKFKWNLCGRDFRKLLCFPAPASCGSLVRNWNQNWRPHVFVVGFLHEFNWFDGW